MKTCQACSMPLEHKDDFAGSNEAAEFCAHCAHTDGSVKSCAEIFEGGVEFFMKNLVNDRALAEKITRKNMNKLAYWQKNSCDILKGEEATDDEFNRIMEQL